MFIVVTLKISHDDMSVAIIVTRVKRCKINALAFSKGTPQSAEAWVVIGDSRISSYDVLYLFFFCLF